VTNALIPRPLARRIDRLARRAHAFHRYAHHPLCEPYRGEVIRMGRHTRLCKGCTFLAAGFLAGIAAGVLMLPSLVWGAAGLFLAVLAGTMSLRWRLPKMLGRTLPGVGVGLAMCTGLPCALGATALIACFGLLYRRRGVERSRCETCHERQRQPCSGFVLVVRRERAFQRKANHWLGAVHTGSHGSAPGLRKKLN
jgi:hypothetical protein